MRKKSSRHHPEMVLYLPYLLISIASMALVYMALVMFGRYAMQCVRLSGEVICAPDQSIVRLAAVGAGVGAGLWFLFAQITYHKVHTHFSVYRLYGPSRKVRYGYGISKLYCLAVTGVGCLSLLFWSWRLAT